jgi:hypothetical protein
VSTFRPVQVPQQPRSFFTPGTSSDSPVPYAWQQQAALFRSREEVQQPRTFAPPAPSAVFVSAPPLQMPRPAERSMVAELWETIPELLGPPAVTTVPPSILQMPAPVRATDIALLVNELTQLTAGTPAGVPPPRTMDQSAAYWRNPSSPPMQLLIGFTVAPSAFVPAAGIAQPSGPTRVDATALNQVLPDMMTIGSPLGVPPPRTQDVQAAYRRDYVAVMQPVSFASAPPPAARVPPSVLQVPASITYRMDAQLAALRAYMVPGVAPGVVPPAKMWEQQAAYRLTVSFPPLQPSSRFIPASPVPGGLIPGRRIVISGTRGTVGVRAQSTITAPFLESIGSGAQSDVLSPGPRSVKPN